MLQSGRVAVLEGTAAVQLARGPFAAGCASGSVQEDYSAMLGAVTLLLGASGAGNPKCWEGGFNFLACCTFEHCGILTQH